MAAESKPVWEQLPPEYAPFQVLAEAALTAWAPNSKCVVKPLSGGASGAAVFRLDWTAVPGVTYTVQSGTSLAGPWQDLGTVTPTTTAGTYNATLAAPVPPKSFFRLALK